VRIAREGVAWLLFAMEAKYDVNHKTAADMVLATRRKNRKIDISLLKRYMGKKSTGLKR